MENKQVRFITNRLFVAVFFIIWGVIWLASNQSNTLGTALKILFIAAGIFHLYTSGKELIKYRKTGEVKQRIDERVEFNNLRASRRGFVFFVVSFALLFALRGLGRVSESMFVAFSGPLIAAGTMIYFISYYMFERKG